ncbi:hypothetical protein TNCV_3526611 [Trichonephila clavipes]|nr:hypothetical protein TNCV_3526611 [Trichonephila clavipes]
MLKLKYRSTRKNTAVPINYYVLPSIFLLTHNENRLTRKDLPSLNETFEKVDVLVDRPTILSEEFVEVDDDVCTAPMMADKDISEFAQSSKIITDEDSDDENEMNNAAPVSTSYEMRNIMRNRLGKGEGSTAIEKHFNLGESTVREIKKNEAAIRKSVIYGTKLSTKFASYTRDVLLERNERAIAIWIEEQV